MKSHKLHLSKHDRRKKPPEVENNFLYTIETKKIIDKNEIYINLKGDYKKTPQQKETSVEE